MAKPVMISVSGIRGIVGQGLSPELITDFSAAAGSFYGPGEVYVGRDSRVTGEMVKHAVFAGLMSVGCSPVDLGICATPSVELAVQHSDAVGGIIITASHNPAEWNALKLLTREGIFLDADQGARIKDRVEAKSFNWVMYDRIGQIRTHEGATDAHLDNILSLPLIDVEGIRNRRFKVAYDCVNGAGGVIVPKLLEKLGCETFPLNVEPTGLFAHTPEPVPENLTDLAECVKKNKADVGFAVDPDVDRMAIVSDLGIPIGEEYTLALAVRFRLSKKVGKVVLNASTSLATEDIAREMGAEVLRTKVGEIHVAKKMQEVGAVIGGEGNGGVILPESHYGRDGIIAIAMTLQAMLESGETVSRLWQSLPQYAMVKKKIEIGHADPDAIIRQIEANHQDKTINKIDGLKIEAPGTWVQIRKSNTEPIIRVMAEARTRETASELCDMVMNEISTVQAD